MSSDSGISPGYFSLRYQIDDVYSVRFVWKRPRYFMRVWKPETPQPDVLARLVMAPPFKEAWLTFVTNVELLEVWETEAVAGYQQ
ncbi:hypothetical protein VVD49_11835 [Uliginosibacterium sp. H3]|uniref:Uncharacterized protein n=1 Tax=Uliginosibacterium silvisoli TaxID=3114758 RepID=A0ABU6K3E5_9RHOO|nr:hypothetical protein [Uliginosibacterium sp. H3]